MLTILLFILVLGVLVFIHELGHFLVARRLGIAVEEFGLGFPPRIVGLRRHGVIYSINWIPFGGFVRLRGENAHEPDEDPTSFQNARRSRRALVIAAGVVMNFVLAIALFITAFSFGSPSFVDEAMPGARVRDARAFVTVVLDDSPAAAAGLDGGETIREINGHTIADAAAARAVLERSLGTALTLVVEEEGRTRTLTVTPTDLDGSGVGKIGAGIETLARVSYPIHWAILNGLRTGVELAWLVLLAFAGLIRDLIVSQSISPDIAGPVGIAVLTGEVAQLGFVAVLQFMGMLSISLAVINLIPFPGLDGGRLLFLGLEAIRKRAVSQKAEAIIHNIGFLLLIVFLVAVSTKDVQRFGIGERIADAVRSLFD